MPNESHIPLTLREHMARIVNRLREERDHHIDGWIRAGLNQTHDVITQGYDEGFNENPQCILNANENEEDIVADSRDDVLNVVAAMVQDEKRLAKQPIRYGLKAGTQVRYKKMLLEVKTITHIEAIVSCGNKLWRLPRFVLEDCITK